MNIRPISIQYYKQNNVNNKRTTQITNPICVQKQNLLNTYPISFCGLISNSDLISNGYKIANISDNKISNNDDFIMISSAEKFLALINSPNVWNKKIVLADDIDLNGAEIKPIGSTSKPFRGEFDGNGCKISNFKINAPEGRNIGLFAKVENAKISNLEVSKAYIRGKQQVGGIAGYSKNSNFDNCKFNGYIEGEKKVGGLIALSKQNKIVNCLSSGLIKAQNNSIDDNIFGDNNHQFSTTGIIGGLVSSDEESKIENSFSNATLIGNEQAGGLIGYSERSIIENCCYNGTIASELKSGGLVGWGLNSQISNSYALSNKNNLVGDNNRCLFCNSYYDLKDIAIKPHLLWSSNIWNLNHQRIPRLNFLEDFFESKKIFLDDLNIDIETGKIKNPLQDIDTEVISENIFLNITPPKHFQENDELLKQIRECNDAEVLFNSFNDFILDPKYIIKPSKEIKEEYKEVLLEFVKNPNMNLNKHLNNHWYSAGCTPLFVITTINEPYTLQEALKRNDVVPTIISGVCTRKTILERAFDNHIDSCVYVLLTSPKMKNIVEAQIENLKAGDISPLSRLLLECYPNLPKYDNQTGCINFSQEINIPKELKDSIKKVSRLQDVQKNGLIDENYRDSKGNNIANVLTTLDDEQEALALLLNAEKIGTDLNNRNEKYETPIGNALYRKMPHIVARLLPQTDIPFVRINDGTDSMLLFSSLKNDTLSTNYMEIARKRGLSINTSDENGNTPLINAVNNGNTETIKFLLAHGANPNIADNVGLTPLHHACTNGNIEAIELLLDSYASPLIKDLNGLTPEECLYDDEIENKVIDKFQEKRDLYEISGISEKYSGNLEKTNCDELNWLYSINDLSSLVLSGQNADYEILNLTKNILLNSSTVNYKDDNGNTILHLIAQSNSKYASECLKAAIEQGANIDATNQFSETPLISALNEFLCATSTEDKINLLRNIKILLDANPNVDLVDDNKQSALHKICQSGNLILFNEILKKNPKITQFDINNNSAFEYAPLNVKKAMNIILKEYLSNNKILKKEK